MTVRITRKTIAALTVVAAAIAATAAFAAIPDGGGVIHGCYVQATGTLRVTDTQTNVPKACTSKETALDWNQQGPQGLQGTPGKDGAKGDPGPSDGYITRPPAKIVGNGGTVASLYLPAGNYLLSARFQGDSYFANTPFGCSLMAGFSVDTVTGKTGASNEVTQPQTLMAAHTFDSAGYATVYCNGGLQIKNVVLTAVQVGALHAYAS